MSECTMVGATIFLSPNFRSDIHHFCDNLLTGSLLVSSAHTQGQEEIIKDVNTSRQKSLGAILEGAYHSQGLLVDKILTQITFLKKQEMYWKNTEAAHKIEKTCKNKASQGLNIAHHPFLF